jgi:hypothetical protein
MEFLKGIEWRKPVRLCRRLKVEKFFICFELETGGLGDSREKFSTISFGIFPGIVIASSILLLNILLFVIDVTLITILFCFDCHHLERLRPFPRSQLNGEEIVGKVKTVIDDFLLYQTNFETCKTQKNCKLSGWNN